MGNQILNKSFYKKRFNKSTQSKMQHFDTQAERQCMSAMKPRRERM